MTQKTPSASGAIEEAHSERTTDARPGGCERLEGRWGGHVVSTVDAIYYDVIENEPG